MIKKTFNVCLIKPEDYIHSFALEEALKYIFFTLRDLGYTCSFTLNSPDKTSTNIIFCAHLLRFSDLADLPDDSIIFNSEQLPNQEVFHLFSKEYWQFLENFRVWDYSLSNLNIIPHERKSLIQFGFSNHLINPLIHKRSEEFFLFYGAVTERRRNILDELSNNNVPIKELFGKYSFERDIEFSKTIAVINLHKSDELSMFEPIRCFYPLINGIPVISEYSDNMNEFRHFDGCMHFINNKNPARDIIEIFSKLSEFTLESQEKLDVFRSHDMSESVKNAIQEI